MKNYKIVSGSEGRKISFAITVGTQEGYGDNAKVHSKDEVRDLAIEWMKAKAASGAPFITGSVIPGTVVYAYQEGPGKAGGGHEPNTTFSGEISHLYGQEFLKDQEMAKGVLNDLASFLGNKLGQTRVYVALGDKNWVLQAEETATPTGETV